MFVSASGLCVNRTTHSTSNVLRERPVFTDGSVSLQHGEREVAKCSFRLGLLSDLKKCSYSYNEMKEWKKEESLRTAVSLSRRSQESAAPKKFKKKNCVSNVTTPVRVL